MRTPARIATAILALWTTGATARSPEALPAAHAASAAGGETVEQALCRLIATSADREHLPVGFLTRLIWQESSFRPHVVSPAGAAGIAQFMPGTAQERGLADPFDPEQAIPASASLLAELSRRFGNIGLAAAAYNGGPARVAAWLLGKGGLPFETQDYVLRTTGHTADEWALAARTSKPPAGEPEGRSCLQLAASLRSGTARASAVAEAVLAPWGVQLAGNFSKALALASFARARAHYGSILADVRPMIIGTRLRTRGTRRFYRVRAPAETRSAAVALCDRIHAVQGACVVLKS